MTNVFAASIFSNLSESHRRVVQDTFEIVRLLPISRGSPTERTESIIPTKESLEHDLETVLELFEAGMDLIGTRTESDYPDKPLDGRSRRDSGTVYGQGRMSLVSRFLSTFSGRL